MRTELEWTIHTTVDLQHLFESLSAAALQKFDEQKSNAAWTINVVWMIRDVLKTNAVLRISVERMKIITLPKQHITHLWGFRLITCHLWQVHHHHPGPLAKFTRLCMNNLHHLLRQKNML
jgi:hypothetical protein